jgi:rhodanese-related sulfurtransferase
MKQFVKQRMQLSKIHYLWISVILVILVSGCMTSTYAEKTPTFENIPPKTAYELIQERQGDQDFVVLDVRTPQELAATGYVENAINIDYRAENFQEDLDALDKAKTYVIYCRSGGRSGRTLTMMEELGFQDVYNVTGGILQWTREELPLVKE